MQSESDTPIEERYLRLEGKVPTANMDLATIGLPSALPPDTAIVFVGFAYADISFNKRYHVVFPKGRPQDGIRCECEIIAATQQFNKPLPVVPHGWKTICAIHFLGGVPQLVNQLPEVDGWYLNEDGICICDETTWEHLKGAV